MSSTRQLLQQHTLANLCLGQNSTRMGLARFTIVYVLTDDYLKLSLETQRFALPSSTQQKGS